MALNGTEKSFEVQWDDSIKAIKMIPSSGYTQVGGELSISDDLIIKRAVVSTNLLYLNQQKIELEIYNIDGNSYFKLRDIAKTFNFNVSWNQETQTIDINTLSDYLSE